MSIQLKKILAPLAAVALLAFAPLSHAATCVFNTTGGAFNVPANWNGCGAGNGVPAGTPGPADRAEISNATVSLPAGNFILSDLFLSNATIQGLGMANSRLFVNNGSGSWGAGPYTLDSIQYTVGGNGFQMTGGPLNLPNTYLTTLPGSLIFLGNTTVSGTGAEVQNNSTLVLTGNLTASLGAVMNVRATVAIGGPITIAGPVNLTLPASSIDLNQQTLTLTDASLFNLTGGGSIGNSSLTAGGIVSAVGQTLTIPSGSLLHSITMNVGTLVNTGATIRPGLNGNAIGTFTVNGNYVQSGTGKVVFDLNGTLPGEFDRFVVAGDVNFNNTLGTPEIDLNWTTPVPSPGSFYDIVSFGSRSSIVDTVNTTMGRSFNFTYPGIAIRATVAGPLEVTSTADGGPGTLREALTTIQNDASCLQAPYDVHLLVAGTIQLATELPVINCATTVNGQFVPGFVPNTSPSDWNGVLPLTLDGGACGGACGGLVFNAPGSVVYGINFTNWGTAAVLVNSGANNMTVHGNYFFQGAKGVSHASATDVRIGAAGNLAARNVFVHATFAGIGTSMQTGGAPLRIENNLIGAGAGLTPGANAIGIGISGTSNAVIAENVIANNTKGLVVVAGTGNKYDGNNKIYANGIGVDLGDDGPSANDEVMPPYDTDGGPNQRLNFPTITSLTPTSGSTATVSYAVKSTASSNFNVFFCRNPGGSAQCEQLIAGTPITTDANGFFAGNFAIAGLTPGTPITMFARADSGAKVGNMSEISPGVNFVVGAPAVTISGSGAFPATNVGSSSGVQTISIQNSGTANLDISAVNMTPAGTFADTSGGPSPNASHYCLFGSDAIGTPLTGAPKTLLPGQSCNINFIFKPAVAGPVNHTLQIISNASTSPDSVALTGTGNGVVSMTVSFAPTTVAPGANATMTLTLTNPNATSASISGGSITIPAGLTATPPGSNSCGTFGSVGGGVYSFGMGSIPGSGSCTIDLTVSSPGPGSYTATVMPGNLSAGASSNTNTSGATLTVTTLGVQTTGFSISPPSIAVGGVAVATMTITNPNAVNLLAQPFTWTHLAGLVTVPAGGASSTCPGAAPTATAGGTTVAQATTFNIPASGSCSFSVSVTSAAMGTYSGVLPMGQVVSGAGSSPASNSATLTVTAGPTAAITLTPPAVVFGARPVNTTSPTSVVSLGNSGSALLNITSITPNGDFAVVTSCPLFPSSLPVGQACPLNITFTPLTVSATLTGNVTIVSDAPGSPHIVALSGAGTATPVPVVSLSTTLLSFPSQVIGSTSTAQTITVFNSGFANLNFSSITKTGSSAFTRVVPPQGPLAVIEGIAPINPDCNFGVAPGGSCTITVTFTPSVAGTVTGQINIASNAGGSPHIVNLTGNGISTAVPIISTPGSLNFGDQITGTSGTQSLNITNAGSATLTISSLTVSGTNAANFVTSGSCVDIASNATCSIIVTFSPTTVGAKAAQITIASNASNQSTTTVILTGNGILVPRPIVDLSVTTIGYGNAIFGGASSGQVITLKNTGGASLQISNLFTTGDFVVMNSCPAVLSSGNSCVINVTFSPLHVGQRSGELVLISNAQGSPHRIPLSGTGCRWFSQAQSRIFLTICG